VIKLNNILTEFRIPSGEQKLVYQFKRFTASQMDELHAMLHRAGIVTTPDFNKRTITTYSNRDAMKLKKNKSIQKFIKSKGGIQIKEGTCGYGVNGKLGEEPAGPNLRKKIKDISKDKNEALSASQAKAAHKKFKETGELPPHLKKLIKKIKKFEKEADVKNIVVPGLEWMSKIKESIIDEACQKGYMTHPTRKTKIMFGKRYRNCVKKEDIKVTKEQAYKLMGNVCTECGDFANENLRKWFSDKWVNIGKKKKGGGHPPCGTSGKKRGYAKCVPASKAAGMSKKQKASATRRKRAAQNKAGRGGTSNLRGGGKKPIRVSTKPKK
tara:strand:+ start:149 stop:1123 length:975 start_codon:yes stop_codon:yes gene_type:complete